MYVLGTFILLTRSFSISAVSVRVSDRLSWCDLFYFYVPFEFSIFHSVFIEMHLAPSSCHKQWMTITFQPLIIKLTLLIHGKGFIQLLPHTWMQTYIQTYINNNSGCGRCMFCNICEGINLSYYITDILLTCHQHLNELCILDTQNQRMGIFIIW